jgi:hypothetical protein
MLIMHLSMLANIYQLLIDGLNLFGFFRKYKNMDNKNFISLLIFFRRTKTLSQSVVDELKKTLTEMGADVQGLKETKQNC